VHRPGRRGPPLPGPSRASPRRGARRLDGAARADAGDPGPALLAGRWATSARRPSTSSSHALLQRRPGQRLLNRHRRSWRPDLARRLQGLIEQLEYLQELGFTAIWITPPVENRSGLDYHGYHGYDFTRIDPRLESPGATYQDLICEVHRRGMRLIQDVVINHSSNYGLRGLVHNTRAPIKYFRKTGAFPSDDPNYPYQTHLATTAAPTARTTTTRWRRRSSATSTRTAPRPSPARAAASPSR
jgi:hypothetical protein